ncbi:hypothetical protein [Micromonospora sp. NPDC005806]|uniref:hypothetical protein n=1 Tax=Micromonospora sp. NPDC005806 TaxID=3364234 RepID=UPI0036AF3EBE
MTDDFTRLRGAMTSLAEHGGSPDLYERALHTSRRSRRRSTLATSAAAAAGVVAIVTGAALSGGIPGPTPPPGAHSPNVIPTTPPSPEPTSGSPSPSLSTATSPSRPATTATSERPDGGCPVTAASLDRVPGLSDGYRISPDTVECWKGWATGWDRNQQGDGMYLFRYSPSRGWRIHGQGSAFDCATLGIPKDPDDPPPFCS